MRTATQPAQQNGQHELSAEQLDAVSGGVHGTEVTDRSSPSLFAFCCNGKHFAR
jgi:type VI protein secretion system component Hcp